ncbi:hypothetical protein PG990_001367 [Apiospora arundinis]
MPEHVNTSQATLRRLTGEQEYSKRTRWINRAFVWPRKQNASVVPPLLELLGDGDLSMSHVVDMCTTIAHERVPGETADMEELSTIIGRFIEGTNDTVRKTYGHDLDESLGVYKAKPDVSYGAPGLEITDRARIERTIQTISTQVKTILYDIRRACEEDDERFEWLRLTTLWPCMSPIAILEQLCSASMQGRSHNMKEANIGDPIAVPFEAKGVPHPQAEFGHPDAAIILTCLSYYYTGVTEAQMMQGLQLVLSADDPVAEFDRWAGGCHELPQTLQTVSNINLEDQKQMKHLRQCVRLNRSVLNFFMNKLVFPIHAKQFSVKLQASGWDIPQFSPVDGCKVNITTGFSAMHTRTTEAWPETQLLREIYGQNIRILIDAGAYILDMDNESVVEQWLDIDKQAKAAVYFKSDNRAWVKYRGKRKTEAPLLATPFADKLEDCRVSRLGAHKGDRHEIPPSAKGALTLALGQTKDHTVQAAMRLRQLKTTQSILFVAPPEVHLIVVDVCKKRKWQTIDSADIVYWLLEQTSITNEQVQGLFFAQGQDYCRRMNAAHANKGFLKKASQRAAYTKVLE